MYGTLSLEDIHFEETRIEHNVSFSSWKKRIAGGFGLFFVVILHGIFVADDTNGSGDLVLDEVNDRVYERLVSLNEPKRVVVDYETGVLDVTLAVDSCDAEFVEADIGFDMRCLNKSVPGPTLVVRPGDTLRITLVNNLGPENEFAETVENAFHSPNTTVIHTHGFHVSPKGVGDNIYRKIAPGESATFVYPLKENHPTGTFYLHPHFQGSSAFQTAYGMVSAIVVEDGHNEGKIDDLVLVTGFVDVGSGHLTDIIKDSEMIGSTSNLNVHGSAPDGLLVVNGKQNPDFQVEAGKPYRLRIINTIIDGTLRLQFTEGTCTTSEIAADGISYAKERIKSDEEGIVIPPGSRRDLLVRCTKNTQVVSGIDSEKEYDRKLVEYLGTGTKVPEGKMMKLKVVGKMRKKDTSSFHYVAPNDGHLYTPEKFRNLRELEDDIVKHKMTISYTQAGPTTDPIVRNGFNYSFYGINGKLYEENSTLMEVPLDEVVEWTIRNEECMDGTPATESHPFHLHTNHFQIVKISSGDKSPDFQVGDWRDTITIPTPGWVTIRWIPRDYDGMTVLHCHTLAHEDTGMIANIKIKPKKPQ